MSPSAPVEFLRAVRVGGRLAGYSAARSYGIATPPTYPLEVHVPPSASRLRQPNDRFKKLDLAADTSVRICRERLSFDARPDPFRVSVLDTLRRILLRGDSDDGVAALDSARHRGLVDRVDVELLRRSLPVSRQFLVDSSRDDVPEYLESIARQKLERAGFEVRVQVNVLDERWIDLLIGDRLAIECDGKGKYENGATVDKDRKRDAFLEALGYHVIRLSYAMVLYDWDATLSMIMAIVDRGDHIAR